MSKQSQMTNFFKQPHNTSTSDNQNSNITKKHNLDTTQNVDEPPLKKVKTLKYKDSYIEYILYILYILKREWKGCSSMCYLWYDISECITKTK